MAPPSDNDRPANKAKGAPVAPLTSPIGRSASKLAKAIFQAELPEQFVRTLPAQSLYLVVKENGLESSVDLIEMTSLEQCRLLLDFDLWHGDRFDEQRLWDWLSLADAASSLTPLQRVLKTIDLKLVALMIERHVEHEVFEEPTENPPAPGFYTPDKGYTWLNITCEDANQQFQLARFLALIFETDADLFYQLLAIPGVQTGSMLEEDALSDRNKRLAAEGVPEPELVEEMHRLCTAQELRALLESSDEVPHVIDVRSIEPLIYDPALLQPLGSLVASLYTREEFEAELSYLMNGAIVRWGVPLNDPAAMKSLAQKVRGALNIGLERALKESTLSPLEAYRRVGLGPLYRHGLTCVLPLCRAASRLARQGGDRLQEEEPALAEVLNQLRASFPELPEFVEKDGSFREASDGQLATGSRAIEHLEDIAIAEKLLEQIRVRLEPGARATE